MLNRKGGSVCLQTWRGVVPLLPGALDKISVGASCQLPQPRDAARQMNRRQPGSRALPQKSPLRVRRAGANAAEIRCQARTRTAVPRISRLARGTSAYLQPACISSCLLLPLAVLGDGAISAGRGKCRPPTFWEAAGSSRRAHAAGSRRSGPARSHGGAFPSFLWQGTGLGEGVTALQGWHEKGQARVCSHGRSLPGGNPAVGADGDPACVGSILRPQQLSGHAAVKPLHPLHVGYSC